MSPVLRLGFLSVPDGTRGNTLEHRSVTPPRDVDRECEFERPRTAACSHLEDYAQVRRRVVNEVNAKVNAKALDEESGRDRGYLIEIDLRDVPLQHERDARLLFANTNVLDMYRKVRIGRPSGHRMHPHDED